MVQTRPFRKRDSVVAFFVLTFTITWGLGLLLVLFPGVFETLFGPLSAASPAFVLAVASPTIAATTLTATRQGWSGVRALYGQVTAWRFGLQWYGVILVGVPLAAYVAGWVAGSPPPPDLSTPASVLTFLLLNLILGPLGEELGWRGYAFPRLLVRFNPLLASLILGAIWGIWHLPAFFLSGLPQATTALPVFLISCVLLAIVGSWIYLHTGRSVPSMVLFHYVVNVSIDLAGAPALAFMLLVAGAAVLVVVLDRQVGWLRQERPGQRRNSGVEVSAPLGV
jgi:uncharacterized protein